MFEIKVLFANILAPALIMLGAYWISSRRYPAPGGRLGLSTFALASFLAIWCAMALRNGWSLWPEDAWQRIPAGSLLVALVSIVTDYGGQSAPISRGAAERGVSETAVTDPDELQSPLPRSIKVVSWLFRLAGLVGASFIIFPSGESWAELQAVRWWWIGLMSMGVVAAWLVVSSCHWSVRPSVGFAFVVWTVAVAFLVSQSFMKVTEPILAMATVLGLASLFDVLRFSYRAVVSVAGVTLFAAAAAVAHGNFYSFLDISRNVYGLAILTPLFIASAAYLGQRRSQRVGQVMAVLVAITFTALLISWSM